MFKAIFFLLLLYAIQATLFCGHCVLLDSPFMDAIDVVQISAEYHKKGSENHD
jgi:hypothetical protein